jgi:hypothetical protein
MPIVVVNDAVDQRQRPFRQTKPQTELSAIGCLLISSETSCEARNVHLDRALLVDTVGRVSASFF